MSLLCGTAVSNSVTLGCLYGFYLGLYLLVWWIYPLLYNQLLASIRTTYFCWRICFYLCDCWTHTGILEI